MTDGCSAAVTRDEHKRKRRNTRYRCSAQLPRGRIRSRLWGKFYPRDRQSLEREFEQAYAAAQHTLPL